jgi:hypothetical protein
MSTTGTDVAAIAAAFAAAEVIRPFERGRSTTGSTSFPAGSSAAAFRLDVLGFRTTGSSSAAGGAFCDREELGRAPFNGLLFLVTSDGVVF